MKVKKIIATGLIAAMLMSVSSICADAAYKVKEAKVGQHYEYYYMSVSTAKEYKKRINTPGIRKRAHTTGSITLSKSQSFEVSASSSVSGKFNAGFAEVGAEFSVGLKTTATASVGTTITLKESAPSGIYYAYMFVPQKKVHFWVKTCDKYHTAWSNAYDTTILRAPTLDDAYMDLIISN